MSVNRNEVEGYGDSDQPSRHSPGSADQNSTTTNRIHSHHVDPRHDKVDTSNDQADSHRIGETDQGKE